MANQNGQAALVAPGSKTEGASALAAANEAYRRQLEPSSLDQAYKLATEFASVEYCGVKNAPDALGRIMTGRSMGLSTTQSMRGLYTVNGRQGIDAGLMHGLCLQSPACEYFDFVNADATQATFVAKRIGRPEVKQTFTIDQAEKAGLLVRETKEKTEQSNWTKWREDMLVARCRAVLARRVFPDVVFGLYTREELEAGMVDEVPSPTRDPNEMEAEIVPKPSTVQAAARDFAKEAASLKARAAAAKTRAELAAVREDINKWDGIDPFRSEVANAYNEANKALKAARAAEAPKEEPPAAAPVPSGNLFAQEPAKS